MMAADTPRQSPDFAVNMNDGSQIHLSQYQGKVVVLAFILTYCSHCQFTAQILSRLQKEYGPQGLQVVASAIDPMSSMKVPDFIKHPIMYRLMMPQVVFIDRKGTIRAQHAGDDSAFFSEAAQEKNIRDAIDALLKEGTPTAHKKRAAR